MAPFAQSSIDHVLEEGRWNGALLQCCGPKMNRRGWAICLGSVFCPCVLFGHNTGKTLSKRWWLQSLLYVLVFFLVPAVVYGPKYRQQVHYTRWAVRCTMNYARQLPVDAECQEAFNSGKPPKPPMDMDCWEFWFAVLWFCAGVAWAAYHRMQLRHKMRIGGTYLGDYCRWYWCSCCSVAQETRTVLANEERMRNEYYLEGLEDSLVEEHDSLLAQAGMYTPPNTQAPAKN